MSPKQRRGLNEDLINSNGAMVIPTSLSCKNLRNHLWTRAQTIFEGLNGPPLSVKLLLSSTEWETSTRHNNIHLGALWLKHGANFSCLTFLRHVTLTCENRAVAWILLLMPGEGFLRDILRENFPLPWISMGVQNGGLCQCREMGVRKSELIFCAGVSSHVAPNRQRPNLHLHFKVCFGTNSVRAYTYTYTCNPVWI